MSKIQNSLQHIQSFDQLQQNPETEPEVKNTTQSVLIYEPSNDSLSETRAGRDGIDYSALVKYDLEDSYKSKNGKGWGKGGKKEAMEELANLEAELNQIIENRIEDAKVQAQETLKEDIKREEINDQQIKGEVRSSEVKVEIRKTETKIDNYLDQTTRIDLRNIT